MDDELDEETVGLRIRYHMDPEGVTQNLMRFKKGEAINELIRKLNNMNIIESCSCEGPTPQKQWYLLSK